MKINLINLYKQMFSIRMFDEKLLELFSMKKISGFLHPSHGHEAIAVGVINAIQKNDQVVSYYRGHGHCLVKGSSPAIMMAEIMGKKCGYCAGKGGSLHLIDIDNGVIATSGLVSEAIPIATGAALANKLKQENKIVVCFFGDGATNNGMFYESLNFASYLKLPILYICENNGYSMSLRTPDIMGSDNIAAKAKAIGVNSCRIDGTDVENVYKKAEKIIMEIRKTCKPFFMECSTVRLKGHTAYDGDGLRYKSQKEINEEIKQCPLKRAREKLIAKNICSSNTLSKLDKEIIDSINQTVEFAESAEEPHLSEACANLFYE